MKINKCYKCDSTERLRRPNKKYEYFICNLCNNLHQKAYMRRNRKLVFDHYGNKCSCCSENEDKFLSIDHVNNDATLDRWESGRRITGWLLYPKIIKAGYPLSYQILCMNCNWGKRMNNGICPHKV